MECQLITAKHYTGTMTSTRALARRLRVLWVIALLFVIAGSLLPGGSLPIRELHRFHVNDKAVHFGAYAVLAFLPALHERRPVLASLVVLVILIGVLLEYGQRLLPGRTFEVADMLADFCGALCGLILGLPVRSYGPDLHWS